MCSTILSSLGESILHRNSLATITDNWVVIREAGSARQILISIDSITNVKTSTNVKSMKLPYLACAVGCLLIAVATACSRESDAATLPFAVIGMVLLVGAQVSRQASLVFEAQQEVVRTRFGTLPEAATVATAIRAARHSRSRRQHPAREFLLWLRFYIALLV
jgi:hypothetical protein